MLVLISDLILVGGSATRRHWDLHSQKLGHDEYREASSAEISRLRKSNILGELLLYKWL